MTDNLIENPIETDAATETDEAESPDHNGAYRPDNVPDKFWDEEAGGVRTDAMIKSYRDMERKLGGLADTDIPDAPDGYEITIDGESLETDSEVDARLHAAGFSRDQAQTVYELAQEKMAPMLAEYAVNLEATAQTEKLAQHFGGDDKWKQLSRQLTTWGRANCSEDIYEALSSTYEGVLTMHRMMQSGEPGLGGGSAPGGINNEKSLKGMMNDRRYWRDRDPAFIEQVRQGFRDLYPGD